MECLNKVILRGEVGIIRKECIADTTQYSFSIHTVYAYTNESGIQIVESMYFNVVAFPGDGISQADLQSLEIGNAVEVEGRLKQVAYDAATGPKSNCYIVANKLKLIKK